MTTFIEPMQIAGGFHLIIARLREIIMRRREMSSLEVEASRRTSMI